MKNCYIIVTKNDYKTTKHLVDNIIDYKIIDHILIIDNNSNEEEKKLISTIKENKIETIFNEEDLGYSAAINKACKHLISKYNKCNFIISNSDIIIMSENDLIKLLDLLDYESVGLVGPQILERGKKLKGHKIPTINKDIMSNIFGNKKEDYDSKHYKDETSTVDVISSAFFLISSKILKRIKFLDEKVFLYYEDNILGYKIKNAGLMTLIHNKVTVKHLFSSTIDKTINIKDRYNHLMNSEVYFHTKYNNASPFQIKLLKLSNKISYLKSKVKKK